MKPSSPSSAVTQVCTPAFKFIPLCSNGSLQVDAYIQYSRGVISTLSGKKQIVNILNFVNPLVSVVTLSLVIVLHRQSQMTVDGCIPIKFIFKNRQQAGFDP